MPTLEIAGVGEVEVDESFLKLSPEEQQATVDSIVASVRGGAPRGESTRALLEATLADAFPGAQISGRGRSAKRNSEVDGAHNSYHLDDMALDVRPLKDVSAEQIKKAFAERGIPLDEIKDEGDHIHLAWGGEGGNPSVSIPEPSAGGGSRPSDYTTPVKTTDVPTAPKRAPKHVITRHMGALNEGIADVAGFPIDLANSALGLVGLGSDKPFLGSDNIRELLHKAGMGQTDETYDPQSGLESYTQSAARGVGQSVLPGLGMEAFAGRQAIRSLPQVAQAGLAEVRAGVGSGLGSQAARDIAPGNQTAEFAGSLIGGLGGAAASKGTLDAVKAAKVKRFVNKQIKGNPYAAYDAEFVEDLSKLTTDRAVSKTDPKGRAKVTVKDVNNLEQRYQGRYKDLINGLDLPQAEKLRLKEALDGDYTMPVGDVETLRGTPQGDAVADAIIMTQRVRALTPEVKRSGGLVRAGADIGATAVGAATHGPLGALAGRGVASILRRSVDGEAARVNSAERLLKRQKAYQKLQEATGPSGARQSKQGLWDSFNQRATDLEAEDVAQAARKEAEALERKTRPSRMDMKALRADLANPEPSPLDLASVSAKRAAARAEAFSNKAGDKLTKFDDELAKPVPEAPITAGDKRSFRDQISDPTIDPRDLSDLVPSDNKLVSRVRARDAAIRKLEQAQAGFDERLAKPPVVKPRAVRPEQEAIDANIDAGIAGTTRTQEVFADLLRNGEEIQVPVPDMLRALDTVEKDLPDLAGEIRRIKNNYPTSRKGIGPAIVPRMRQVLEQDGTIARLKAQATEAKKQPVPDSRLPTTPQAPQVDMIANFRAQHGRDPNPASMEDFKLLTGMESKSDTEVADQVRKDVADNGGRLEVPVGDAPRPQVEPTQRVMRQVDRPAQWSKAAQRYVDAQNRHAEAMVYDPKVSPNALETMRGIPEKLRDEFKTRDEAMHFFDNSVVPDLQMSGSTPEDIDAVRSYMWQLSDAKPYKTPAELEAGTAARPRGRPRKN